MYYQIWCAFLLFVHYYYSEIDKDGIYHVNFSDFDKHFYHEFISSASINLFGHNEPY